MMQGTISVIVTAHNRPEAVGTAIRSALSQTRPPDELIVVDDGSSEDVRAAVSQYPGARYVWQQNAGPAAARNTGLRMASGDYVNYLDDDDWFLPDKLRTQSSILDHDPTADLVYCRVARATAPGRVVGEYLRGHRQPADAVVGLLRENFVLMHAPLVRRERLLEIGGFDASLPVCEDYDCWLRLALAGARFRFCDRVLAVVRVSPASVSADRTKVLRVQQQLFAKNASQLAGYRRGDREWWLARPAYTLGRQAFAAGDLVTARRRFAEALTHDPTHRHARLYHGLSYAPAPVRSLVGIGQRLKQAAVTRLGPLVGVESRWR